MARCSAGIALFLATLFAPLSVVAQNTQSVTTLGAVERAKHDSALTKLLQNASVMNRLPDSLVSYKADVQTELALVVRHADGTETVGSMEQLASSLRWTRAGMYDQHVVGFRSEQIGLSLAMLFLQTGWVNPVLYGNRLRALRRWSDDAAAHDAEGRSPRNKAFVDSINEAQRKRILDSIARNPNSRNPTARKSNARNANLRASDTVAVIHPLAVDRDRYYVYSRGDTLVTLRSNGRTIPIVRVHVEPRADIKDSVAIFIGDIDLDVTRGTLVRMRGYFARAGEARRHGVLLAIANAIAFIEFENAEHDGKYWLPAVQRIEFQVVSPLLGDARAVMRLVSRVPTIAINDTTLDSATLAKADSLRGIAHRRFAYASNDSLARYSDWNYPIGSISAGLHSDDFNDIGPDRFRPTGAPRFDVSAERVSDVVHYDRIEGLYTGLGARVALRDVAPGVVVRASAGWAWSEKTARGRVSVDRTSGPWILGIRAGRSLDITNDFRAVTDSGGSFGALTTSNSYDYIDRRSTILGASRSFFDRRIVTHAEFGIADDRAVANALEHGLFGKGKFLPNRGVDEGGYRRTAMSAEWRPHVDASIYKPSVTARLLYERGDGALTYQRAEFRTVLVQLFGPFTLGARGDAGQVFGRDIPPQQLFELGQSQILPGYKNKEFAGSRAAALRTVFMYKSPFFADRIHITRNYWIPGLRPGASVGVQSGWADASTAAARASILRLGMLADSNGVLQPISRVTDRVRTTVSIGLRFFSGNVFVGYARAIDHKSPWQFRFWDEF